MTRNTSDAVRELCLCFPETEEKISHGMSNFRVRGKTFVTYAINLHGDGRVALWLEAPPGSQALYTEMEPEHYFIPPYVGPRGWLGLELGTESKPGLSWKSVGQRVREAYEKVAPAILVESLSDDLTVAAPSRHLSSEEIDPLLAAYPQKVLKKLGAMCDALPEVSLTTQFGDPVWKAGKKSFLCVHHHEEHLSVQVWVGIEQQGFLIDDERFSIPPYMGHNGWIDLNVEDETNWLEIESLVKTSYRHFALKRMLKQLD